MPKGKIHPKKIARIMSDAPRADGRNPVTVAGTGAAGMRDATVRMKKVMGGGSVLQALGEAGDKVKVAVLQKLAETDDTHDRHGTATVSLEIEKAAIVDIAGGASPAAVAIKYDIQASYVAHALRRRFGSVDRAKEALQGLVLENGLACMVKAATEIHNMSGPQAVMSGAILIDKAIALEKSIADKPKTIDFGALAEMGKTLRVLREVASEGKQ